MSHRLDEKQARRAARLAAEAEERRQERRNRIVRWAGFGAVAGIAVALITLAITLNGGEASTMDPHAEHNMGQQAGTGTVGTKAPAFAVTDAVSGRTVTSASLAGKKTMLFFSEGVSCQACLVQAADLEKAGTLKKAGIQLISVTTDPVDQLAQAAKQYGLHDPMLADSTGAMSTAYGMLGHGGMGHPTQDGHAFMLIGRNGKILWHKAYQEMYVKPTKLLSDLSTEAQA